MALNAVKAVQATDDIRAYSLYIDGKWAPAFDGAMADDFNPATGAPINAGDDSFSSLFLGADLRPKAKQFDPHRNDFFRQQLLRICTQAVASAKSLQRAFDFLE